MIARMNANVKMAQGANFQSNTDPALLRDPMDIIMERVDHCKDVQFVKGEQLFGVLYTTIHKAAMDGSCAGISWFISPSVIGRAGVKRANVDDYDKNSICPIHYAAERGHDHVVSLLIEKGCDPDIETGDQMTPLMYAAKEGKVSTIQTLYDNSAKLLKVNRGGMTAAHFAAQGNHVACLDLLLKLGAMDRLEDIELAKAFELKRLADSESATVTDAGILQMDTSTNADIERINEEKAAKALRRMLGKATEDDANDDREDGNLLEEETKEEKPSVKQSVKLSRRNTTKSKKIVQQAPKKKKRRRQKFTKTLQEVLDTPENIVVDTPSLNGLRPLHMAAMCNSLESVRFLIASKVDIEAKDNVGETALHKAARKSYFAIYNLLVIDGHADEMTKSISHQTPSAILKDDMN